MTKQEFINKYIYGIDNDALTDNQEAIDMAKDLDKYVAEQLRQYNISGQSEQLLTSFQVGEKVLLDDHTEVEVLVAKPKLYIRQNELDSEMWVNTERLKKKSL